MSDITLQRGHTALLIADFYTEIMNTLPHSIDRGVVDKAVKVQATARNTGAMVCYCATVFRPSYPEIGQRNKTFNQRKNAGQLAIPDPMDVIHPSVHPSIHPCAPKGRLHRIGVCTGWPFAPDGRLHRMSV